MSGVSAGRGDTLAAVAHDASRTWYRFGDGYLELRSDDDTFNARFQDLYRECLADRAAEDGVPTVGCAVRTGSDPVSIDFDDSKPLDQCAFTTSLLGQDGYYECEPERPGWRTVRSSRDPGRLEFRHGSIRCYAGGPWQSVVAALALHRVLRLQPRTLFFHAGSIGIGGAGVLLFGAKGAGKTTLSLALADAGHAFLGDEISAVRMQTLELLPFRRRLSIRIGPACPSVARALEQPGLPTTTLADGTIRYHLHADSLQLRRPETPLPVRAVVVLRARSAEPRLERFRPTIGDLQYFVPLESTTWLPGRGTVATRVLALASRVPCYKLDVGPIPSTVSLLETLSE